MSASNTVNHSADHWSVPFPTPAPQKSLLRQLSGIDQWGGNPGSPAKIQRAIEPHIDHLTIIKRHKLQWYGHVSHSSGLAKTILQGTVKGGRRQGRQKKGWEDNIREWTGLPSPRGQLRTEKKGGNWLWILCSTPTTLVVKGFMMMMMIKSFEICQLMIKSFEICQSEDWLVATLEIFQQGPGSFQRTLNPPEEVWSD